MIFDFLDIFKEITYYFVIPLIIIATAILGIVIFSGRAKSVRFLGMNIFLSSLAWLSSKLLETLTISLGTKVMNYTALFSIAGMILGLGSTVCFCIFIHKNDGMKFIYALLLICSVAEHVLVSLFTPVIAEFLANAGLKPEEYTYWLEMLTGFSSFLLGSVSTVIVIVVLMQNRKSEKVIPFFWLIRIMSFVWSIIALAFSSIGWLSLILAEDPGLPDARSFFDMTQASIGFFTALVALAAPIYILIASKRAIRRQNAGKEN